MDKVSYRRDWVDVPHDDVIEAWVLRAQSTQALCWNALIDMAFVEPRQRRLLESNASVIPLYQGRYAGPGLDGLGPVLVALPAAAQDQAQWLRTALQAVSGRPALSLIAMNEPQARLADYLSERMEAVTPDGDGFIVRWADTRCLPIWVNTLDDAQCRHFLDGIDAWCYLDRRGQWTLIERKPPARGGVCRHSQRGYELDQAQLKQLEVDSRADAVTAYLRQRPEVFGRLHGRPSEIYRIVEQALGEDRISKGISADIYRQILRSLAKAGHLHLAEHFA